MLSYSTVDPDTLELLKNISSLSEMQDMRLVGGTSLALQYGHRKSIDLDFFGKLDIDKDVFDEILMGFGNVIRRKVTDTIRIYQINGVKVDFVDYRRYNWIGEAKFEDGICLASVEDIAAMKINAIEGRGTKKDFIDIYYLLKHFTLSKILDFYKSKYPEHSCFRALISLSYFDDAEQQPMPYMFDDISWNEIKKAIEKEVYSYSVKS